MIFMVKNVRFFLLISGVGVWFIIVFSYCVLKVFADKNNVHFWFGCVMLEVFTFLHSSEIHNV